MKRVDRSVELTATQSVRERVEYWESTMDDQLAAPWEPLLVVLTADSTEHCLVASLDEKMAVEMGLQRVEWKDFLRADQLVSQMVG